MKNDNGFSLVELLIVVAIIGVITAIAVPSLVKARQHAQAGSAIQSLRTIVTAEALYKQRTTAYATLTDLAPDGTIDPYLQAGQKSGYLFDVKVVLGIDPVTGKNGGFTATGDPMLDPTSAPFFYVDDTAVIRWEQGATAGPGSTPIPR